MNFICLTKLKFNTVTVHKTFNSVNTSITLKCTLMCNTGIPTFTYLITLPNVNNSAVHKAPFPVWFLAFFWSTYLEWDDRLQKIYLNKHSKNYLTIKMKLIKLSFIDL